MVFRIPHLYSIESAFGGGGVRMRWIGPFLFFVFGRAFDGWKRKSVDDMKDG